MEVRDVRRMAVTVMLAGVGLLLWLWALWAQHNSGFEWGPTASALDLGGIIPWTIFVAATLALLTVFLGLLVFGVDVLPPGWAKGTLRQVQCDECRAVFMLNDTGHRPLTHQCPNCHYLGIYDGTRKPVGDAHRTLTRHDITRLAIRCGNCAQRFHITDSGVRPLRVECPMCQNIGKLR